MIKKWLLATQVTMVPLLRRASPDTVACQGQSPEHRVGHRNIDLIKLKDPGTKALFIIYTSN